VKKIFQAFCCHPGYKVAGRSFSRACLDWTERKHHLAGSLGAALLTRMLQSHWLRAAPHSRVPIVTGKGQKAMKEVFKVEIS
jgi:hypothetical protein